MDTAFNAEKTEHCSVTGALAAGETLRLRLVVPRSFGVSACTLLLTPDGEEHFLVTARVAVSPQFYAWVLGFGSEAEILGPASVREGLKEQLNEILSLYQK